MLKRKIASFSSQMLASNLKSFRTWSSPRSSPSEATSLSTSLLHHRPTMASSSLTVHSPRRTAITSLRFWNAVLSCSGEFISLNAWPLLTGKLSFSLTHSLSAWLSLVCKLQIDCCFRFGCWPQREIGCEGSKRSHKKNESSDWRYIASMPITWNRNQHACYSHNYILVLQCQIKKQCGFDDKSKFAWKLKCKTLN